MRRALLLVSVLAALAVPGDPPAAPVLDGRFDEWQGVPVAAVGREGGLVTAVRLGADAGSVYLQIDMSREAAPQAMDEPLTLLLDVDGNASTGARAADLDGVDARLHCSPRSADGGPGLGVSLEAAGAPLSPYDLAVEMAPSYASRRLEWRMARGRTIDGVASFAGARWRGQFVSGGQGELSPLTPPFEGTLPVLDPPAGASLGADVVARTPDAIRVVSWNVARRGFFDESARFGRVLSALEADVLVLDEVDGTRSVDEVARVLAGVRGARGGAAWRIAAGEHGGPQRTIVASQHPLEPVAALGRLSYPAAWLAGVRGRFGSMPEVAAAIDRLESRGLSAAAAVVEVGKRRLLVTGFDLECCGRPDDPAEAVRRVEAEVIAAAVRDAVRAHRPDAVVLGGDANLVGTIEPLDLLRRGTDLDEGTLAIVEAWQLDRRSQATWRATDAPRGRPAFNPGRLDWQLVSARLGVAKAFAFDAAHLSPAARASLGVEDADSRATSDHLPVVSDLSFK